MQIVRIVLSFALAVACAYAQTAADGQNITVTGKLIRQMAIGGESTGWAIQLESQLDIAGKPVNSLEIDAREKAQLERLENRRVEASGTLSRRHGVETGDRSVLAVSSIREVAADSVGAPAVPAAPLSLAGSEWLLEDLGGSGVIDNIQATLAFPELDKVSGNGSCNRFFGPARINRNVIHIGPLGATRMACPQAVMNQETRYLKALQAADRFTWQDPYLLLYCKGFQKPLRFTRKGASVPHQ